MQENNPELFTNQPPQPGSEVMPIAADPTPEAPYSEAFIRGYRAAEAAEERAGRRRNRAGWGLCAASAVISGFLGYGLNSHESADSRPELPAATAEPNTPANATPDWRNGSTIVHFVRMSPSDIPTSQTRDRVLQAITDGTRRMNQDSKNLFPNMPVKAGGDIDISAEDLTEADLCEQSQVSRLHNAAFSAAKADNPDGRNLEVVVFDTEDVTCPEGKAFPQAAEMIQDETYPVVVINDTQALNRPEGAGIYQHELVHGGAKANSKYGHDSTLRACGGLTIIDVSSCSHANEYGNATTISGSGPLQTGADSDPFTSFEDVRLGLVSPAEIAQPFGSATHYTLQSLRSPKEGTKVIRIPVSGASIPSNKLDGKDRQTPTDMFIELSSSVSLSDKPPVPEVKVLLVNDGPLVGQPSTYMLPVNGEHSDYGLRAEDAGQARTFIVGDKKYTIKLGGIQPTVDNQSEADITIEQS